MDRSELLQRIRRVQELLDVAWRRGVHLDYAGAHTYIVEALEELRRLEARGPARPRRS